MPATLHGPAPARYASTLGQLQGNGRWTFAYLGANQDLAEISARLHIPSGNTNVFRSDEAGAEAGWASVSHCTRVVVGSTSSASESFFGDSSARADAAASEPSPWAWKGPDSAKKKRRPGHGKN